MTKLPEQPPPSKDWHGSSETEVRELTLIPCFSPPLNVVTTETPVATTKSERRPP
jgi:hypothetical protein